MSRVYHALIRTHHITSRRKVGKLKEASHQLGVYVLLKTGTPPGILYVQGPREGVEAWMRVAQSLRYKDFHVIVKAAEMEGDGLTPSSSLHPPSPGVDEVATVKDFGQRMDRQALRDWWRRAMGYTM